MRDQTLVGTKRLCLVGVMIGVGLVAGVLGWLSGIDPGERGDRGIWLPSVVALGEIRTRSGIYRNTEGLAVLEAGSGEFQDRESLLAEKAWALNAARSRYEKILGMGKESELYGKYTEIWEIYQAVSTQRIFAAIHRNDRNAAFRVYQTDSYSLFDQANRVLDELIAFNAAQATRTEANRTALNGETARRSAFMGLGIGIGAVLAFALCGLSLAIGKADGAGAGLDRETDGS
ncbi:methyl-accepting chemotaxis sensory transducer [Azospirillum sp. B510]|uniref:MCP four helix bundle domain-containing protein n=1 Tax=Azospirillum sp. (strain B510) TaxID=137722 RepID=UPI0001C4CA0D|nr:MCP four helix bundle domain-containing protein [Azospirillum sp. B510]BAI73052.1 methyl-accepting chemotaxis sensory transducer [Azospirillum sp. B510]